MELISGDIRLRPFRQSDNPASQHVLEKCGFVKEGVFKKAVYKDGGLWDEVRYAILNPGLL